MKPLYDKVRDVEEGLAAVRAALGELDVKLADETLYVDQSRKDELTQLVQEQVAAKTNIESLEWEWLEATASCC